MVVGRIQFEWERRIPPGGRLSFGLFFRPILPRLRRVWSVASHWPLRHPLSEVAQAALQKIETDVTPPDTVLPALADEIVGDRDEFFGFLSPPASADRFLTDLHAAGEPDQVLWKKMTRGTAGSKAFKQSQEAYEQHVREHGTSYDRFLAAYPVEFAFMTNDTVWWFAARDDTVLVELQRYAAQAPGMTCEATVGFGF